jgi:glutaconate CoA-transferase, subunit A
VKKTASMAEAVESWVRDGDSVVMGACLEALIPFSAGHEIARQRKQDLTLICPISDMLFDQLIGAGCVSRIRGAWVGNVSAGLGHNYRRASERGIPRSVVTEDNSNFSIALGLLAGALGTPYIPTKSLLGSDILRSNASFKVEKSPFDDEALVVVPALRPDLAILHVQRSDESGTAHAWGNLGVSREALMAADKAIIVAEEIVGEEIIRSDPNRVLGPAHKVVAVVHEPGGAHPSPVQGYYNRDHEFFHEYHETSRSLEGWRAWEAEWIREVPDRARYLKHLGSDRWEALRPKDHAYAAPVDYGY